ncbi:MAG TPA: prepilin-type N-terminal cleavage/methylation domain-containing protein [Candidatus Saccharimonadales bacterium]|nr:prepilin-type N-terminal cleavage/methylation domain-containing protein [Candidatus Saccharimonadales bacterium]
MIDRLRSHLKSEKGFTLIELLVVIAIIAILVVIVVVAINPVERLRESTDRAAAANVRATGTLLSACMTKVLSLSTPGTYSDCDTQAELDTYTLGKIPTTAPTVTVASTATDLCASAPGRVVGAVTTTWFYRHSSGAVSSQVTAFTC